MVKLKNVMTVDAGIVVFKENWIVVSYLWKMRITLSLLMHGCGEAIVARSCVDMNRS